MDELTITVTSATFARLAYLRAKLRDSLSEQCHAQALLFASLNHDETAVANREAHTARAEQARKLFRLYPHPGFLAGRAWANANGFSE
jgi:hypothetical protein